MKWKLLGKEFKDEPLIEAKDHREATTKAITLYCTCNALL